MKARLLILALALTAVSSHAQRLWKVTPPPTEAAAPSYIFGTHHTAPVESVPQSALDALAASRLFVSEIDASQAPAIDPQMMIAPADSTLDKLLTPAELDTVMAAIGRTSGRSVAPYRAMIVRQKPIFLSLPIVLYLSKDKSTAENLDGWLQSRAAAAGAECTALETARMQFEALLAQPLAEQAAELLEISRDLDEGRRQVDLMLQTYLEGNLDSLLDDLSSASDRLLNRRNSAWVWQLDPLIRRGAAFIAVGAGHLPGSEGLLSLLSQRGFTVTPVE